MYKKNLELFTDILGIDKFIHTPVRQLRSGATEYVPYLRRCSIILQSSILMSLQLVGCCCKENIRTFIKGNQPAAEDYSIIDYA